MDGADDDVPGFELVERIGEGASGQVWRARDLATGATVAVKRLRRGPAVAGAGAADALDREAALLAAFRHPHVIALRAVVRTARGPALVLDYAEGGSLGGLLAVHRRLTAAEVVTAISPIADALAAAHARGLVHGDVSPGNILLTADGRPLLADLGTARLLGERARDPHGTEGYLDPVVLAGSPPGPAQDVYALAAVAAHALTGAPLTPGTAVRDWAARAAAVAPAAIVRAVADGLTGDLGVRPDAGQLAAALRAAVVAAPLPMPGQPRSEAATASAGAAPVTGAGAGAANGRPAPRTHAVRPRRAVPIEPDARGQHRRGVKRTRARRLVARTAGAAALLGLAVWGGVAWGAAARHDAPAVAKPAASRPHATAGQRPVAAGAPRHTAPSAAPTVAGHAVTPDWQGIVETLDDRRVAAFAAADPSLLAGVYQRAAPARAADAAAIAVLRQNHARAVGLHHVVLGVTVRHRASSRVLLRVVDRLPPYDIVDGTGRLFEHRPGRGRRAMLMRLARHGDGWRIAAVTAARRDHS